MSLEIEDGFNFALGEWIAESLIGLVGVIIILGFAGIVYLFFTIYEYISDRRSRK